MALGTYSTPASHKHGRTTKIKMGAISRK